MVSQEKMIDLGQYVNTDITYFSHAGWNTSISEPLIGDFHGVHHNFDQDLIESAGIAIGGVGGWTGMIWMGRYVQPQGNQEKQVEVTFEGHMDGYVTAYGSSSSSASIEGRVECLDSNSVASTEIGSWSASTVGSYGPSGGQDFSETLTTELDSDDTYRFKVQLICEIDCLGPGETSADFGRGDGDDYEGVTLDKFSIVEK